jgi:hypothetical protein
MPGASGNKRIWKGRLPIECRLARAIHSNKLTLSLQSSVYAVERVVTYELYLSRHC